MLNIYKKEIILNNIFNNTGVVITNHNDFLTALETKTEHKYNIAYYQINNDLNKEEYINFLNNIINNVKYYDSDDITEENKDEIYNIMANNIVKHNSSSTYYLHNIYPNSLIFNTSYNQLYYSTKNDIYLLSYNIPLKNGFNYNQNNHILYFDIDHQYIKTFNDKLYFDYNIIQQTSKNNYGISTINTNQLDLQNNNIVLNSEFKELIYSNKSKIKHLYQHCKYIFDKLHFYDNYHNVNSFNDYINQFLNKYKYIQTDLDISSNDIISEIEHTNILLQQKQELLSVFYKDEEENEYKIIFQNIKNKNENYQVFVLKKQGNRFIYKNDNIQIVIDELENNNITLKIDPLKNNTTNNINNIIEYQGYYTYYYTNNENTDSYNGDIKLIEPRDLDSHNLNYNEINYHPLDYQPYPCSSLYTIDTNNDVNLTTKLNDDFLVQINNEVNNKNVYVFNYPYNYYVRLNFNNNIISNTYISNTYVMYKDSDLYYTDKNYQIRDLNINNIETLYVPNINTIQLTLKNNLTYYDSISCKDFINSSSLSINNIDKISIDLNQNEENKIFVNSIYVPSFTEESYKAIESSNDETDNSNTSDARSFTFFTDEEEEEDNYIPSSNEQYNQQYNTSDNTNIVQINNTKQNSYIVSQQYIKIPETITYTLFINNDIDKNIYVENGLSLNYINSAYQFTKLNNDIDNISYNRIENIWVFGYSLDGAQYSTDENGEWHDEYQASDQYIKLNGTSYHLGGAQYSNDNETWHAGYQTNDQYIKLNSTNYSLEEGEYYILPLLMTDKNQINSFPRWMKGKNGKIHSTPNQYDFNYGYYLKNSLKNIQNLEKININTSISYYKEVYYNQNIYKYENLILPIRKNLNIIHNNDKIIGNYHSIITDNHKYNNYILSSYQIPGDVKIDTKIYNYLDSNGLICHTNDLHYYKRLNNNSYEYIPTFNIYPSKYLNNKFFEILNLKNIYNDEQINTCISDIITFEGDVTSNEDPNENTNKNLYIYPIENNYILKNPTMIKL